MARSENMTKIDTNSDKTTGYKLYRKWQWRGLSYRSDVIAFDYMRRWVVNLVYFLLRLHKIKRSDNDRHFHDHPFDFTSLILWGGYVEYRPGHPPREYKPFSVVRHKATDLHYLKLRRKTAWTFVITSPYYREWGFQTEEGWIRADEYDAWLAARGQEAR